MPKVAIRMNEGQMLLYAGSIYKGTIDALKEYISNAWDAYVRAKREGLPTQESRCEVHVHILSNVWAIESYSVPGLDLEGLTYVARNIANSTDDVRVEGEIGQFRIGIWAGLTFADDIRVLSRSARNAPTSVLRVKKEDLVESGSVDIATARSKDRLIRPGVRVEFRGMTVNRPNISSLVKKLGVIYRDLLLEGVLQIWVHHQRGKRGPKTEQVIPAEISLQPLKSSQGEEYTGGTDSRPVVLDLYFDPSGKGAVSVKVKKIPIIEKIEDLGDDAETAGLQSSVLASGFVSGSIYDDGLILQPTRAGVHHDTAYQGFLGALLRRLGAIDAEVKSLQQAVKHSERRDLYKAAAVSAVEVCELIGIDPLRGYKKKTRILPPTSSGSVSGTGSEEGERKKGRRSKVQSSENEGKRSTPYHPQIEEVPFGNEEDLCSVTPHVVRINSDNPDYRWSMKQGEGVKYISLMLVVAALRESGLSTEEVEKKLVRAVYLLRSS